MRTGPVHYYRSLNYLLDLACGFRQAHEQSRLHFATDWALVTCEACRAARPLTEKEQRDQDRLRGFLKGEKATGKKKG